MPQEWHQGHRDSALMHPGAPPGLLTLREGASSITDWDGGVMRNKLLLLLSHFSRVQLCDPIDCSPPGSPVPGILQARVLEWGAIAFSKNKLECPL